jgi:hypothetical protein
MKLIQPNCRIQFTAEDVEFIISHLSKKPGDANSLIQLLTDPDTRDQILDDAGLFHAMLENCACLKISTHFYFYVLVRHVLKRSGIEDRAVADYVAEMLAEFSRNEPARMPMHGAGRKLDYFFEMLAALDKADDRTAFMIRAHIGNSSLFLSGVFLGYIRHRAERRGAPDLSYYEQLGRTNYRVASDHRLAQRYEVGSIFPTLSERFQTARLDLNDLADRLISLSTLDASAERWLAQAMRN